MAAPIVFYFDFVSGYSYLAVHRIDAIAARHGRTVAWRCLSLPHVFKALGHPLPATLRTKWDYAMADWARSCDREGLPHAVPEVVPLDARVARQVFWHLNAHAPAKAAAFAVAVFDRYWGSGRDASAPAHLAEAGAAVGLGEAALQAAAGDPAARQAIVDTTAQAVAAGVFGAPFFLLDGEPFWGADRLDQIEWRLSGGKAARG
jgi:2-hydroxychromene-2-carboxylate isomerase